MTDYKQQLRNNLQRIADDLENPPRATEDGNRLVDEYPDAVETEEGWVTGWWYHIPAEERDEQVTLTDTEEEAFWTVNATGEMFDTCSCFEDDEGGLVMGGDTVEGVCEMSAMGYLSDALDITHRVNSDRTHRDAEVLVGCGGPNIWIDTRTKTVKGAWGGDTAEVPYVDNIGLDDALEELWDMGA